MRNELLKRFYNRVLLHPDAHALDIDGQVLTYVELWRLSCNNAKELKSVLVTDQEINGQSEPVVVALHFNKSIEFVVAQLSCWIAEVAFLPLDTDWPEQRKLSAIKAANSRLLVFNEESRPSPQSHYDKSVMLCWPNVSESEISNHSNPEELPFFKYESSGELAYIIFTSGSSGTPKGVVVSFDGLVNIFDQQANFVDFESSDRMLWLHHVCFDASIADVWVTLLVGGTLVANTSLNALDIMEFITSHFIAYVDLPASLMPLLSSSQVPAHLKTVLVGGEVIKFDLLKAWSETVKVVIAYGPSEASICTSMHVFTGDENQSGYIGEPIYGIEYYLQDKSGMQSKLGETGELIIVGKGVALGYLNAQANDDSRFLKKGVERAYRTGDLVQKTDKGFRFVGRVDRQFKLSGKLLCPEEVEHVLLENPQVTEARVFRYGTDADKEYCIAISCTIDPSELVAWMKCYLPIWMCSPKWLFLSILPRNVNGKVDNARLIQKYEEKKTPIPTARLKESLKELVQKYAGCGVRSDTYIKNLSIDSIQWLRVFLDLRNHGFDIPSDAFFRLLNNSDATIGDIEDSTINSKSSDDIGEDSSQLTKFLSHYPELEWPMTKPQPHKNGSILITGATGNLGGLVLSELIKADRIIFCLVRESSEALKKFRSQNKAAIADGKIVLVFGDIAKPQFGLEGRVWNDLAAKITEVYHCAADTSVIKPLDQVLGTNVTGTYQVLDFCAYRNTKRLNYASTLALIVDSSWRTREVDESNTLSSGRFYGGYAQSKWLAEQLVQRYPYTNIIRLGLLIGDPRDQKAIESDLFGLRLKGMSALHNAPEKASFDFTPIEQAAKLVCLIGKYSERGIYHLHNPETVSAKLVQEVLCEESSVSFQWQDEDPNDPYRIYKMTGTRVCLDKTAEFLASLNASLPSASNQRITEYLKVVRS